MKKVETIKPPINSKIMSTKDKIKLTYNLNNGNLAVFLEVKDENNNLIGFQEVMTVDNYYNKSRESLKEYASLNNDLISSEGSERRTILRKIQKLNNKINELKKIKVFMLKDEFSFTEELENLGSYKKEDIVTIDGKYLSLEKND